MPRSPLALLPSLLPALFALLAVVPPAGGAAASTTEPDPVAVVGGRAISRSELEAAVAPQLAQLAAQRAEILARGLDAVVAQKLAALEAERQGTSVEALLARVDAAAPAVTETEVGAFYAENQARIRKPLEAVRDSIRQYLEGEARSTARERWNAELRGRFPVDSRLEPYRVALDNGEAPVRGPASAAVEVTVFSDFECPWCRKLEPSLDELEKRFPSEVRVAFRHLPLVSLHPHAEPAALAAVCADAQERFWPFHDRLFGDPSALDADGLVRAAGEAGLDVEAFEVCRTSPAARARLAADVAAAGRLGLASTPSIFVNGRPVQLVAGRPTVEQLAEVVGDELARRRPAG